jgi:HK97 family phage prohead protease
MAITVNSVGIRNAKRLIRSDDIDRGAWSFSAADGNSILGDPEKWTEYAKWFIAEDTGANEETKDRYKYPFGKNGKIYRRAVIAAKSRAAAQGETDIANAADELLQVIDAKEERNMPKKHEVRSAEIRAVNAEEGTFEAYACTWNEVDSYNSVFTRGCFAKTVEERVAAGLVKVLDNHGELIGVVTSAVEDDHGLRCIGRLTLEVQRAAEVRALMRDGAITTMSFGFDSIKETRNAQGQRVINEVRLWEISPVTFAANEKTSIVDVRSADFNETLVEKELNRRGDMIWSSLLKTLYDISWANMTAEESVTAIDVAWEKAHAAYVQWAAESYGNMEQRAAFTAPNELARTMFSEYCGRTIEEIAADSPLSKNEIRSLTRGETLPLEARKRLAEFNPAVAKAHAETRGKAVETLFSEVRAGGFSQAEKSRFTALIGISRGPEKRATQNDEIVRALGNLNTLLEG